MFDRGFDLDAEFLFVVFETGVFDGDRVVAGKEAVELKLAFLVGDAL